MIAEISARATSTARRSGCGVADEAAQVEHPAEREEGDGERTHGAKLGEQRHERRVGQGDVGFDLRVLVAVVVVLERRLVAAGTDARQRVVGEHVQPCLDEIWMCAGAASKPKVNVFTRFEK